MQHDRLIIEGGKPLSGVIEVKGAKNAALKMMAAALLSDEECLITNLPKIEDVERMKDILISMGVVISENSDGTIINPQKLNPTTIDETMIGKLRASVVLTGPLLARTGEVFLPHPGGCNLGQRPIDIFLDGFRAMGAEITTTETSYRLKAKKLRGTEIFLPKISVTATETFIMAAVLAEGKTTIKNSAMEPEIPALIDYLNTHGAKISGAGTPTITIEGVPKIGAGKITLIPDRIEAGTFAILGAMTNSEITIKNCDTDHLESLWLYLNKVGATFELSKNQISTKKHHGLKATNIKTHEYPGFVTDLQPAFTVLMTQATGLSIIQETIFSGRLFYTDLLSSMGANIIMCDPYRVVVSGPTALCGRYLVSPDIRAGIALILAGLIAGGKTTIDNVYQIDRGYEQIVNRLANLGANIKRETVTV